MLSMKNLEILLSWKKFNIEGAIQPCLHVFNAILCTLLFVVHISLLGITPHYYNALRSLAYFVFVGFNGIVILIYMYMVIQYGKVHKRGPAESVDIKDSF